MKQKLTKEIQNIFKTIEEDLKNNNILVEKNDTLSDIINRRYNHSNGRSAFLLININGDSNFNHNQITLIKSYDGEFDQIMGYWFISI